MCAVQHDMTGRVTQDYHREREQLRGQRPQQLQSADQTANTAASDAASGTLGSR